MLPFLLNGLKLSASPRPFGLSSAVEENARVLVLVRLNGGNDGLNMVTAILKICKLIKDYWRCCQFVVGCDTGAVSLNDGILTALFHGAENSSSQHLGWADDVTMQLTSSGFSQRTCFPASAA